MRNALKDGATIAMALVLLALVVVEYFFAPHDHPRFPWHRLPGYAALIGLLGSILVVRLSKALGKWLLQRPETDD